LGGSIGRFREVAPIMRNTAVTHKN
jgi:hypothetical protein